MLGVGYPKGVCPNPAPATMDKYHFGKNSLS